MCSIPTVAIEFESKFRALYLKLADESDPRKAELLKQRLRLLLLNRGDLEKTKEQPLDQS